jgi:hypothetical protein
MDAAADGEEEFARPEDGDADEELDTDDECDVHDL